MNFFMRVLFFSILHILNLSCSQGRKDLFLDYARINCNYKKAMVQRDSLKAELQIANSNFNQKSNELNELTERLDWQIVELENIIVEIKMQYEQHFNKI